MEVAMETATAMEAATTAVGASSAAAAMMLRHRGRSHQAETGR
jgi:hypothetical protein